MLAYFGIRGATSTDTIAKGIKDSTSLVVRTDSEVKLRRRLRILGAVSKTKAAVMSEIYRASGTTYADAKGILQELTEEGLVTTRPNTKTRSTECFITQKGLEYVSESTKAG